MKIVKQNEQGFAHIILVLIVVLVLAAIGGTGYYVFTKQKGGGNPAANTPTYKVALAECKEADKDICKFMASWKENKYYTITSADTQAGVKSTTVFQMIGTDKYHMTSTGGEPYELISMGNIIYTKDFTDGKWWKQTIPATDADKYKVDTNFNFEESKDSTKPEDKTTYKKVGTEECGKLKCFKYQILDPTVKDTTDYIWFDNKDYQLRRTLTTNKDGTSDAIFSYDKFEITAPTNVKELTPNQVLIPGQSEPSAFSSQAEIQQALDAANAATQDAANQ